MSELNFPFKLYEWQQDLIDFICDPNIEIVYRDRRDGGRFYIIKKDPIYVENQWGQAVRVR